MIRGVIPIFTKIREKSPFEGFGEAVKLSPPWFHRENNQISCSGAEQIEMNGAFERIFLL